MREREPAQRERRERRFGFTSDGRPRYTALSTSKKRGEGAGDGPMKRMTMCPRESEAVDRRQRGVDRKEEGSI